MFPFAVASRDLETGEDLKYTEENLLRLASKTPIYNIGPLALDATNLLRCPSLRLTPKSVQLVKISAIISASFWCK